MKMGRLTNAERYQIQSMISNGDSYEKIAKKLDRSEKVIQKYAEGELVQIIEHIVRAKYGKELNGEPESPKTNDGFVRQDGAVIMTKDASERGDKINPMSQTNKSQSVQPSSRTRRHLFDKQGNPK